MSLILSFHTWLGIQHHFNKASWVTFGFVTLAFYPDDCVGDLAYLAEQE